MNVAVIAWGSLIWSPRQLAMSGRWHRNGPRLPIEYLRKSSGGRLTLVIHPGLAAQATYWIRSGLPTLGAACSNLAEREGSSKSAIRSVTSTSPADVDDIARSVREWLETHADIDAAIWTGLLGNLQRDDPVAAAVGYLTGLRPGTDAYVRAKEYVVNTPAQVQTAVRSEMQQRGWADAELATDLFEPDSSRLGG